MSAVESTAADITAGTWVRFPDWERWRYVLAARHVPFSSTEPRGTGHVTYDATSHPGSFSRFYGFTDDTQPCRIVRITPQAVAS